MGVSGDPLLEGYMEGYPLKGIVPLYVRPRVQSTREGVSTSPGGPQKGPLNRAINDPLNGVIMCTKRVQKGVKTRSLRTKWGIFWTPFGRNTPQNRVIWGVYRGSPGYP